MDGEAAGVGKERQEGTSRHRGSTETWWVWEPRGLESRSQRGAKEGATA